LRCGIQTALFLAGTELCPSAQSGLLQLAAASGFRTIFALWSQCDPRGDSVLVHDCREVNEAGRITPHPGVIRVTPALVAVLSRNAVAIARGRKIVAASGAFWAHCLTCRVEVAQREVYERVLCDMQRPVSYGVAEFSLASVGFLRLVSRCPVRMVPSKAHSEVKHAPKTVSCEEAAKQAFQRALALRGDELATVADPLLHRTLAPCAVLMDGMDGDLRDPLRRAVANEDVPIWREMIRDWLREARSRRTMPEPLTIPGRDALDTSIEDESISSDLPRSSDTASRGVASSLLPKLFATPLSIETVAVDVSPHYLDPDLEPKDLGTGESRSAALQRILGRRRTANEGHDVATQARLVEVGVGRACLVDDVRITTHPELRDFTVLGVGMTPFSEGGYIEIGRKIDGKAALTRAWHRKSLADRLEAEGCRTGRVVAILEVKGEEIEMPDGNVSPAALITRGFRCAFRVKQLDPLVMCLQSVQHAPLVGAFLLERARELRAELELSDEGGLNSDDALAYAIEAQGASQASLRELVGNSERIGDRLHWPGFVRQARLAAIDGYARLLVQTVRRRVANDLSASFRDIAEEDYLFWFAQSLGAQLAAWRRLRFLHDYHHPGIGRWHPDHLYTLGENNVTLMAEFPDLDTGVFVDDDAGELEARLQLLPEDVAVLRERFGLLHQRDVQAAETVVRTLSELLFRDDAAVIAASLNHYWRSYDVSRASPFE
jgi:hypothetical protein